MPQVAQLEMYKAVDSLIESMVGCESPIKTQEKKPIFTDRFFELSFVDNLELKNYAMLNNTLK